MRSFQHFRSFIGNESFSRGERKWDIREQELKSIDDESYPWKMPPNCQPAEENLEMFGIFQAIVRSRPGKFWLYSANKLAFEKLRVKPTQFSFLMVHEWLWDHVEKSAIIFLANGILHSHEATKLSDKAKLISVLKGLGVSESPLHLVKKDLPVVAERPTQEREKRQSDDKAHQSSSQSQPIVIKEKPRPKIIGYFATGCVIDCVAAGGAGFTSVRFDKEVTGRSLAECNRNLLNKCNSVARARGCKPDDLSNNACFLPIHEGSVLEKWLRY